MTPEAQAKMLAELGYAGIGYSGTAGLPEMLQALDKHKLKMFSTYVGVILGPDGPTLPPNLDQAIEALKGRETVLWLTIRGRAPDADAQAVQAVREIAEKAGVSVDAVTKYRRQLGIPAAGRSATASEAGSTEADRPRGARRRKSKLDPYFDLLGKVEDRELATMAGVTRENVRAYRKRHGIPATWTKLAKRVDAKATKVEPASSVEAVEETAARELKEETGLAGRLTSVGIKHKMDYSKQGELLEDKYFFVFRATNLKGRLVVDFEGGKNQWLTKKEISKLPNLFDGVDETVKMLNQDKLVFSETKYTVSSY